MNLITANTACAKHSFLPLRLFEWRQYRTSKIVGKYAYDIIINEPTFGDTFHATLRILDTNKCKSVSHISRFETEEGIDGFISEALLTLPGKLELK